MSNMLTNGNEYLALLKQIVGDVASTQYKVTSGANREAIQLFWRIGCYLNENNGYGTHYIDSLSHDLRIEFPSAKWANSRNLRYMAKFSREVDESNLHTLYAKLSWSHNKTLMDRVKDLSQREWYCAAAIENGWSHAVLVHQIQICLFERQTRQDKVSNFERILPAPQSELAQQQMKDPYVFDFITKRRDISEYDIEQEMVKNVTKLLLELGTGFAFLGNQYHLEVNGNDFYLDLLFYNTRLRCYVVIELKNAKFKPEYVGKLNFYLTAVDELLCGEYDNPSVGLLLCREKDNVIAEWSLRDVEKPIGVSEYHLSDVLPSVEDIQSRVLGIAGGEANE